MLPVEKSINARGTEKSDKIANPISDDLVYFGAGNDTFALGNGKDTV